MGWGGIIQAGEGRGGLRGGEMRASQSILCTAITQKRPESLNSSFNSRNRKFPDTPKMLEPFKEAIREKNHFSKLKHLQRMLKQFVCGVERRVTNVGGH